MRVNQANSSPIQNADTAASKKAELKKAGYDTESKSVPTTTKTDSVNAEISSKAKEMAKAKQLAHDAPDVREAKIAELKEKIQNKKYDVSPAAIADKLVDDHLRMTGA